MVADVMTNNYVSGLALIQRSTDRVKTKRSKKGIKSIMNPDSNVKHILRMP
jgi:hypothetical protein